MYSGPSEFLADIGTFSSFGDGLVPSDRSYERNQPTFRSIRLGDQYAKVAFLPGKEPDWLSAIVDRLTVVAGLSENWDSYGSAPVDQRALQHALSLLIVSLMHVAPFVPRIWATKTGKVEIQWHAGGKSLELEIDRDGQIHAFYCDDDDPDAEWEEDAALELDRVVQALGTF